MDRTIDIIIPPLDAPYSYILPNELESSLNVGDRISVSFNRRIAQGYVVNKDKKDISKLNYRLKEITTHEQNHSSFSKEQLGFFKWISNYYGENLSNVIDTAVPTFTPTTTENYITLNYNEEKLRGSLQNKIVDTLKENPEGLLQKDIISKYPTAASCIRNLSKKNILKIEKKLVTESTPIESKAPSWAKKDIALNVEQKKCYKQVYKSLKKEEFNPFLLYGVTGSGKTEVYFEAINEVLNNNKGVILIVPEIALTPQLVDRFKARLSEPFALLHSGLNNKTRWNYWKKLLSGEIKIAIGARSAIFAPVKDIGLIIVDEEHDGSYKQSDRFRYNARDLAVVRAKQNSCPIILGSATPTIESIYNAHLKKYNLLTLKRRHAKTEKNTIEIVDLSKIRSKAMPSRNISPRLYDCLKDSLDRNEQAFILYNRRGYASYLQCDNCNEAVKCKLCSLTLTYHKENTSLVCHHCGYTCHTPSECEDCKSNSEESSFSHMGAGTEKVFDELCELFPDKNVTRLDRDVANNIVEYRRILDAVREKEIDILVGTQMIAKGHDLPEVTLVGVINCDVGLHIPDFRSSERIFQLLTQVSGRAGRGDKEGKVILQTRAPKHPSIFYTSTHDYMSFVNSQLQERKSLGYPPFSKLLRIVISSKNEKSAQLFLEEATKKIDSLILNKKLNVKVLGPVQAPITKLRNYYRSHVIFKSNDTTSLQDIAKYFWKLKSEYKNFRFAIDLDPQDLL